MILSGAFLHPGAKCEGFCEIGPRAIIGPDALVYGGCVEGKIGARTKVWRGAHVSTGAVIGDDCMIGMSVFVADVVRIGDRVRIQNHTNVSRFVTIEDDVYIGAGVQFCNSVHPDSAGNDVLQPITVRSGASIGCNVCLIGNIEIGEGATIGANAVVTKSVPAGETVKGIPAK
jgi:UDP-2-acetamido-3-amino-2,3-dideoxy-glucuronate N-acetyltransferase